MDEQRFPELIKRLYETVAELEKMFEGRPFTPDGHMVGSIGECLARHYFGLKHYPPSHQGHDARRGRREVEIKATQGRSIALRSEPDVLLVLKLTREGSFTVVYNGPGAVVWNAVKNRKMPKNGQHQVTLNRLAKLQPKNTH